MYMILCIGKNQTIAREAGAIDTVLDVMKVLMNNAKVCESGCGALMSITRNNGK